MGNGTPSFRLVEPQANQFTLEFLMPACFINALDNEEDLVQRFGVSWEAARNRLRYLHKKEKLYRKKAQVGARASSQISSS